MRKSETPDPSVTLKALITTIAAGMLIFFCESHEMSSLIFLKNSKKKFGMSSSTILLNTLKARFKKKKTITKKNKKKTQKTKQEGHNGPV